MRLKKRRETFSVCSVVKHPGEARPRSPSPVFLLGIFGFSLTDDGFLFRTMGQVFPGKPDMPSDFGSPPQEEL